MLTQNFKGKTALVIGGTSGMGKATAQLLLTLGADVIIASKRKESVDRTITELQITANLTSGNTTPGRIKGMVVDVTVEEGVRVFVGDLEDGGRIDLLVNAAGIFRPKPFLDATSGEYDALVDMNRGFYFITQAVARKMKATGGGGSIVNIGSYWADHAVRGTPTSAYSIAKAGLHAFTQHAAMELAEFGIRVNAIAPGLVETNVLNELAGSPEAAKEVFASLRAIHPMGRNGTVHEIAAAIVFLLSDESAWTTGAILPLDGGMSAGRN
jgi:NAD(P)-dependent dehydrogenase (short-subunit alcohol dehydrogenase family)